LTGKAWTKTEDTAPKGEKILIGGTSLFRGRGVKGQEAPQKKSSAAEWAQEKRNFCHEPAAQNPHLSEGAPPTDTGEKNFRRGRGAEKNLKKGNARASIADGTLAGRHSSSRELGKRGHRGNDKGEKDKKGEGNMNILLCQHLGRQRR